MELNQLVHIVIVCILVLTCLSLWVTELITSLQRNNTMSAETSQKYTKLLLDIMLSEQTSNASWENSQLDSKLVYNPDEN